MILRHNDIHACIATYNGKQLNRWSRERKIESGKRLLGNKWWNCIPIVYNLQFRQYILTHEMTVKINYVYKLGTRRYHGMKVIMVIGTRNVL